MIPDTEIDDLLGLAGELARRAGRRALELRDNGAVDATTKSSPVDLVTEADRQAEALITDGIHRARPADSVVGEEGTAIRGTSGLRWVIDPIDGTTNFVYRIPAFGVSIAIELDGRPLAGTVYDPSRDVLFQASAGRGATRNGLTIGCSTKQDLDTALVATGFSYHAERRRSQAELLVTVLPRVRDIRRFGSAALDLCAVADGTIDAYYERGLNHWDLAAGALIAAEAGATVGDLQRGAPQPAMTLATAPALFEPLRTILVEAGADRD